MFVQFTPISANPCTIGYDINNIPLAVPLAVDTAFVHSIALVAPHIEAMKDGLIRCVVNNRSAAAAVDIHCKSASVEEPIHVQSTNLLFFD